MVFTIQEHNPELHEHMCGIAADALALADVAVNTDVPIIEQLNGHSHPYIRDARAAIMLTLATREAVQLVLTDPTVEY